MNPNKREVVMEEGYDDRDLLLLLLLMRAKVEKQAVVLLRMKASGR
jgi:hypothetical protein